MSLVYFAQHIDPVNSPPPVSHFVNGNLARSLFIVSFPAATSTTTRQRLPGGPLAVDEPLDVSGVARISSGTDYPTYLFVDGEAFKKCYNTAAAEHPFP